MAAITITKLFDTAGGLSRERKLPKYVHYNERHSGITIVG
jgi:hypothetical protein